MSDSVETAVLAGGCAWIMQQLLRQPDGVVSTRTGWTGGTGDDPSEENPEAHAEAVEVRFDPQRRSSTRVPSNGESPSRPSATSTQARIGRAGR